MDSEVQLQRDPSLLSSDLTKIDRILTKGERSKGNLIRAKLKPIDRGA